MNKNYEELLLKNPRMTNSICFGPHGYQSWLAPFAGGVSALDLFGFLFSSR
jgi:hypothetical protein